MLAVCMTALLLGNVTEEWTKIASEHAAAVKALDAARRRSNATKAEIASLTNRAKPDDFAARMLKVAKQAPESSAAFDAVAWILKNQGGPGLAKTQAAAADLLLTHQLGESKLPQLCTDLANSRSAAAEQVLRGVLDKAQAREARGKACYALSACLVSVATWADYCQFADSGQRRMMEATPEGRALLQRMSDVDANALRDEAKALATRASKEFADMRPPAPPMAKGPTTPGVGGPAIGKPAPEIIGEDLNGKTMKLSDYRGKVVVIEFWGWWCVYCRSLFPADQSLISRMRGRPFALLGVNSDVDLAAAEKAARTEKQLWPTWPSWRNGRAIAVRWSVIRWPTTIVLDHRGVVRHVGLTGKELEDAVEVLVKEVPPAN